MTVAQTLVRVVAPDDEIGSVLDQLIQALINVEDANDGTTIYATFAEEVSEITDSFNDREVVYVDSMQDIIDLINDRFGIVEGETVALNDDAWPNVFDLEDYEGFKSNG